jgi:hypothetical protein
MNKKLSIELSKILKSRVIGSKLKYPLMLSPNEIATNLSSIAHVSFEEAMGYVTAFFDILSVFGVLSNRDDDEAELKDEIHASTAQALILATQEGVCDLFDFTDSEDVENPYYGSWFLYQLEKRRLNYSTHREETRICEHVIILVKGDLRGEDAFLLQDEGSRAWGKYKFIGGRVRSIDNGNPLNTARRELKQEVRTKLESAVNITTQLLSREPFEYSAISKRLGAYTLYRTYVFECVLELPEGCLTESFLGEKGRVTTWFPISDLSLDNPRISQKEVLDWVIRNKWLKLSQMSTNQLIKGGSTKLRHFLESHFSIAELRDLCFSLQVNFENIEGEDKQSKVIALVSYFERRGKLYELEKVSRELRPNIRFSIS